MGIRSIKVDKITAAIRQLEMAIELFFNDRDEISVHTLAAAAFEILKDIANQKGISFSTRQKFDLLLKETDPEMHKALVDAWNRPQNYFKHADRDASMVHDFNPGFSGVIMYEAVNLFHALTGNYSRWGCLFQQWFEVEHKDIFSKTYPEMEKKLNSLSLCPRNKKEWLGLYEAATSADGLFVGGVGK